MIPALQTRLAQAAQGWQRDARLCSAFFGAVIPRAANRTAFNPDANIL